MKIISKVYELLYLYKKVQLLAFHFISINSSSKIIKSLSTNTGPTRKHCDRGPTFSGRFLKEGGDKKWLQLHQRSAFLRKIIGQVLSKPSKSVSTFEVLKNPTVPKVTAPVCQLQTPNPEFQTPGSTHPREGPGSPGRMSLWV